MNYYKETTEKRFWGHVEKTTTCWLWQGGTDQDGYGIFSICSSGVRRSVRAHRYAYKLTVGPIPLGRLICHVCDTPCCVRPDHLFAGSNSDNMKDAIQKGRIRPWAGGLQGESNGRAKLTAAAVATIKRRYETGERRADLAREYKVHWATLNAAINGETWKYPHRISPRGQGKKPYRRRTKDRTAEERFLEKCQPEPNTGCWIWIGAIGNPWGYGAFRWNGTTGCAHIFAYQNFIGIIPHGYVVHHKCHNRWCVNPSHLAPASRSENWKAMPENQRRNLIRRALAGRWPKKELA